jgi:hypothetical protein
MLTSESVTKIMPAFIKAQAAFKPAVKDAKNPHFKSSYVTLEGAIDAVSEALRANGIALLQQTDVTDQGTILISRLFHESGEWIASRYPVHPVKHDPQGEGSALTYARRYALMSLVGIAPEDDDGNAATAAANRQSTLQAVGKVDPKGDAWAGMDGEQREFLEGVVREVLARVKTDWDDAWDYLVSQRLDADEKVAVWSQLDSKTRTALKKAEAKLKDAA